MCFLLTKASIAWNLFLKNLWWLKCWHTRVVLTQSLVWTEKECDTFSRGVSPHPISLPSHIVHTNIAAIVKSPKNNCTYYIQTLPQSPKNNCYFTFGAAGYLGQSLVQSRRLLSSSCSLFKSAQLPHFRMLQQCSHTSLSLSLMLLRQKWTIWAKNAFAPISGRFPYKRPIPNSQRHSDHREVF